MFTTYIVFTTNVCKQFQSGSDGIMHIKARLRPTKVYPNLAEGLLKLVSIHTKP